MKNNYKFKKVSNKAKYFFIFILAVNVFSTNIIFGQNKLFTDLNQNLYKTISFGEKISFDGIDDLSVWKISKTDNGYFNITLHGNEINNFVFEKSGNYTISFQDIHLNADAECNHSRFPEKMDIVVTPYKMNFDFSNISFSQPIEVGQDCSSITISIPVEISIDKGSPKSINVPDFRVSGIGCEISAIPLNPIITLKSGTQIISYRLNGVASKPSYLMFDFTDFNNNITTYNYNTLVK